MPTTFVTAAQAEKQVTSHQARLSHAHTFGTGRYLLDGLKLTMETSNRLKAGAGVMLIDGSYVTVDEAGQEWTVENGAQAMRRIDLAGYEYSVGEDGMESLAPKVLKGTPHATAPTMPTYAKGSLLDRPAKLFVPVAKVELDGIAAKPPTCVLDELPTVADIHARMTGAQKILAEPTAFMDTDHKYTFAERMSEQVHGVVLAWCGYDGGAKDWDWIYTFVPKWHVSPSNKGSIGLPCFGTALKGTFMSKFVYLEDDCIYGRAENYQSFTANGITVHNEKWVLRYVIGV